jgi:GNAT superfamily N-acetyltransferase
MTSRRPPCAIEAPLRDGRMVCLRTIRPSDKAKIRDGIAAMSGRSRYLRFFSAFRTAPESIVKRLSAVDGHDHIGWGAILLDGAENPPIAAAHAIRDEGDPACAELAVAVLDAYQGLGLARMLIAPVLADCLAEGLVRLDMNVLAENRAAIALALALGGDAVPTGGSVSRYRIGAEAALTRLAGASDPPGLASVTAQL